LTEFPTDLEVREKYADVRRIFTSFLGLGWECGQKRSFVFDILHNKVGVRSTEWAGSSEYALKTPDNGYYNTVVCVGVNLGKNGRTENLF